MRKASQEELNESALCKFLAATDAHKAAQEARTKTTADATAAEAALSAARTDLSRLVPAGDYIVGDKLVTVNAQSPHMNAITAFTVVSNT